MSQHADEELDQDLLLEFSTEPDLAPAVVPAVAEPVQPVANVEVAATEPTPLASLELIESLNARVERLEQTLDKSASQIASLKSVVATLVGSIDDIKKTNRPSAKAPPPPAVLVSKPRRTAVSAIAVAILGIALGVFGWIMWSRDSLDTIAAQAEMPVQQLAATDIAPSPAVAPASDTPDRIPTPPTPAPTRTPTSAPARETRARVVSAELPVDRIDYVGTLSIDAAPGGEVFIDRRPAGRTPLRVSNLKAGSHLVWIERDGYRRFTRVVHVPADQVSRLWADLEPIPAR